MTEKRPVVSIVMPTRNRAGVLPRAMASVLGQTFDCWELIVVDDASADSTPDVLAGFAGMDARIRTYRVRDRIGAAAARNIAIRKAQGGFVAFLDDDDEWLPEKLSRQLGALRLADPDVGLVHCQFVEVAADGRERLEGVYHALGNSATRALCRGNFLGHSSVLVHRSVLDATGGFDERLPRLQDWDLWIRLSMRTRFEYVPVPLVLIHVSPRSISASDHALLKAGSIFEMKYESADVLTDAALADLLHTLGALFLGAGISDRGLSLVDRAIRLSPSRGQRLQLRLASLTGLRPERVAAAIYARWLGTLRPIRSVGPSVTVIAARCEGS